MSDTLTVARRDGKETIRMTVVDAANALHVPTSSLNYYITKQVLGRYQYGPYLLVDLEEARAVLEAEGYKKRSPKVARG